MAQPMYINVPEGFDMGVFARKMTDAYQAKGYAVQPSVTENTAVLILSKDLGGINTVLGMGEGVTINCTVIEGRMTINFVNEEWTSKIIACAIGWICCFIPFITGLIGVYRQVTLPNTIGADATMFVAQSAQ